MLLTFLVIVLIIALLGGWPAYNAWGINGGMGWVGTLLIIVIVLYLLGIVH